MRSHQAEGVRKTVTKTIFALMGMFAFAFALVPLYDVFCEVTGINGKVSTSAQQVLSNEVNRDRYVTVQFITRTSAGLPWRLGVETRQVQIHPGQMTEVDFTFSNRSQSASWGRAVPSVSPSTASAHVRKVSCFCFQEQRLDANENLTIPLVFQLDNTLPEDIATVTLVYTLYPLEESNERPIVARHMNNKNGEI
ncbi:cytochrome c oxidase assembly protein subunit 11 [Vreelandella subterranea]|uniref:Cytochrome c oxidase assembly protein CtaG n=1 Tax=Vreelandella subterranea TaxID=416874 RepID=A0A1H9V911_9GAMM|nr:cytochrome c oxidase assembly protein [Halomonas subterranea]SES18048.1 cytochrome c oxidase assembly protein subunit 11 [Halomonas subterranea]